MRELFELLVKANVTPNELFILYCRQQQVSFRNYVDPALESDHLQKKGLLTEDFQLSSIGKVMLAQVEAIIPVKKGKKTLAKDIVEKIGRYRMLFPAGINKVKKPYRTTVEELIPRFTWFFTHYPHYNMDIVLRATAVYIEGKGENHEFTRTAGFFVKKQESDRTIISDLATYCQLYLEGSLDAEIEAGESVHVLIR